MLQNVSICIPTKNRPELVRDILEKTKSYYPSYGLTVIYFDSSDNDDTRKIIQGFAASGYKNLIYKHMDSELCLDRKTFEIFSKDKDVYNSDYIWYINDSISIIQEALDVIDEIIDDKYDLIRLPASGDGKKEDYITNDIDDWFNVCSKSMAHMVSTIMRTTLLKASPAWDELYDKYVVTDTIGDGKHEYFFTIGLYLEQIAKLKSFSGIMIGKRMQWRRDSVYKKARSCWNDIVFDVWARSYCDTILKLPDVYTNKENVIRISDNIVYGRFELQNMIEYRKQGLLTQEVVTRYKQYWNRVSTLTFDEIMNLATAPLEEIANQFGDRTFEYHNLEENIEQIERELNDESFIVFGAGIYGANTIKKLMCDGYGNRIIGVAVSDVSVNLDYLEGYRVQCISDFVDLKETATVLIATLPDTAIAIESMLHNMGYRRCRLVLERII